MNDQKEELKLDETGIEIPALTSKPKKLVLGIVMGLFLAYLLINLFWVRAKEESKKINEDVAETNIYPIPKIKNDHDESIKKSINPNDLDAHPSTQDNEDKKLLMLRQYAPVQMYLARDVNAQPLVTENTHAQIPVDSDLASKNTDQNPITVLSTNEGKETESNFSHLKSLNSNSDYKKMKQVERLKHQDTLLLEGTVIPGILQTAIHSDLSGNLKATVLDDIYALKGKRILIPKGSTLLGHYSGTVMQQQSRIVVIWTRIIRPDGISVKLQAQGTDELGQAGLTGSVNHHFLARFGQASLLSLLGAGIASHPVSPSENYTLSLANGFANTSKDALQESMHVKPTITIKAGTSIAVYVNQDISFYDVLH